MDWSRFYYLIAVIPAGAALVLYSLRSWPALSQRRKSCGASERLLLVGIVVLGVFAIYFNYFSGVASFAYLDVGNDTSEQYVPYYLNLLDGIRSGSFDFWNHDYGLGVSFMSYQSWTLDPFNLVLVPLGLLLGNSRLALVLVLVHSLRIIVSALLFDALLSYYCETPLARVIGAALFSLSGYLILWGQHYWLGTVFVLAVALVLSIERYLERSSVCRFLTLVLAVLLSVATSVYSGFMVMLFAATYTILRVAYLSEGVRDFFSVFWKLALPVLCGLVLSSVTVLPYSFLMLRESTRVVGATSPSIFQRAVNYLGRFIPLRWVPMVLSRLLGNGLLSIGSPIPSSLVPPTDGFSYVNVYELPMFGLSGGAFLLLSQFYAWLWHKSSLRARVVVGIATLLVVLYCFNFFIPALSNAMVAPKYRSSFYVVLPVCIAVAVGLDRCLLSMGVDRPLLVASCILSLLVIVWSLVNTVDGRIVCLWYLLAVPASAALLWALGANRPFGGESLDGTKGRLSIVPAPPHEGWLFVLACLFIVSTSVCDGFFSTNRRDYCEPSSFPESSSADAGQDTMAALAWLKEYDPSFWRAEKLYSDWTWLNDSLIEHYQGVSSYNSTLDSDVEEFFYNLWPDAYAGDVAYQSLSRDPDHPELLSFLGVRYLLSRDTLEWDWCRELTQVQGIHVYQNNRASSVLTLSSGVISEADLVTATPAERREMLPVLIVVPDECSDVLSTIDPAEISLSDLSSLDLSWISFRDDEVDASGTPLAIPLSQAEIRRGRRSELVGNCFANVTSVACLAVPNVSGWTVSVDGREVELFRANYGFIGFVVPAGVHSIEARYTPPLLGIAAALSLGGFAATVLCCVTIARKERLARADA